MDTPAPVKSRKRPLPVSLQQQRFSKNHSKSQKIYLVVVESHQHVLEHIHSVLRKEKLLTKEWSMLHFDAHPDLACPNPSIPAKACFQPHTEYSFRRSDDDIDNIINNNNNNNKKEPSITKKNLYEMLDSTATGIAEWILPLVLAANLRRVHWIKQTTTVPHDLATTTARTKIQHPPSQLPCGIHDYNVGAAIPMPASRNEKMVEPSHSKIILYDSFVNLPQSATVKVDWPHPYYLEDDCTVRFGTDTEELFVLTQPLQLQISSFLDSNTTDLYSPPPHHHQQQQHQQQQQQQQQLWELDICLDYFACQNPFLTDLEVKYPVFSRALSNAVFQSRFYATSILSTTPVITTSNDHNKNKMNELQNYRTHLQCFWKSIVELLSVQPQSQDTLIQDMVQHYYNDNIIGRECLLELVHAAVAASPCCVKENDDDHDDARSKDSLIEMTRQMLPNMMMPHNQFLSVQTHTKSITSNSGDAMALDDVCSTPVSMDQVRPALEQVKKNIEQRYRGEDDETSIKTSSSQTPPFMITIARSCNDGFTPLNLADQLQDEIIQHLHNLYCGCDNNPVHAASEQQSQDCTKKEESNKCQFHVILDYGPWEGSSFF